MDENLTQWNYWRQRYHRVANTITTFHWE